MRHRFKRWPIWVLWAVLFVPPTPGLAEGSLTNIKFCNNYARTVYVAIAYEQATGHWLSRGWMAVSVGGCGDFDSALRVPIFYMRAETDWYRSGAHRRTRDIWGANGDRSFTVVENSSGSFNYYDAETKAAGDTNEPFVKFFNGSQLTLDGDSSATVTFTPEGKISSSITTPKTK